MAASVSLSLSPSLSPFYFLASRSGEFIVQALSHRGNPGGNLKKKKENQCLCKMTNIRHQIITHLIRITIIEGYVNIFS